MLNNIGLPGLSLIADATLVRFGRGKVSALTGELASSISAFRKAIRDGDRAEGGEIPAHSPGTQSETGK